VGLVDMSTKSGPLKVRILHLEDNPADAELIRRDLKKSGIEAETVVVEAADQFREKLTGERFDLVISDYNLPGGWNGLDALSIVRSVKPGIPFIFVSGNLGEEKAIDAMRRGATDYVLKDRMARMPSAVRRAIEEAKERDHLREVESQLLHAQKMEAVGRLAGGVAHDFNNLLTVINGYSELLISSTPPLDPRRNDLEEIRAAGQRAAGLTRQLLAFSRRQVFTPVTLDLNTLIANLQKMLVRLIEEDVRLELEPAADLHPVNGDPGQIEQVIVNLVVNARDAMPSGGRVTVSTANIHLDEEFARSHVGARTGPHVRVSIADTGVGMPPEVMAHLFEPFFTTKEKGKGTGLGLSTVHGIVRQSGGVVAVRSEPGKGTHFDLFFPRAEERRSSSPAPAPVVRPGPKTEMILVVEDMDTVRRLARAVLEADGYQVLDASDEDEALRICEKKGAEIRLLLVDIVMKTIGGLELAQEIRRRHPQIRVVLMSGYSDRNLPASADGRGPDFLSKPFTIEALRSKVREVLDRPEGGAP